VLSLRRDQLVDAAVAAWCGVVAQVAVAQDRVHGSRWWLAPLFLLVGWPLLVRRRLPLAALLCLDAAVALQALLTWFAPEGSYLVVALFVSLYSLGAYGDRRAIALGVPSTVAALALQIAADPYVETPAERWSAAFWSLVPFLALAIGLAVGARRRATRVAAALAESEARQELAVAEERKRIARDLHDVIAHHVSVSVVQAVAAQGVLPSDDDAVGAPLRRIESSSREAMRELRRMLGLLREPGADDTAPQPGLSDLPALVDGVRASGLEVDLVLPSGVVEEAVGITAYRLVQEALTNVLKHAQARRVEVRLDLTPEELVVQVHDDGHGTSPGVPGYGLAGMAERVSVFGGRLDAGPDLAGGFRVRAVLPVQGVA
jgi:signal transduction histidine kinase